MNKPDAQDKMRRQPTAWTMWRQEKNKYLRIGSTAADNEEEHRDNDNEDENNQEPRSFFNGIEKNLTKAPLLAKYSRQHAYKHLT